MARTTSSRADQILEVATELFYTKGYGHVGVDKIGNAAGLSGPAIYRHFKGGKGEILAALFDQAIDGLLAATGGATGGSPADDLEQRVHAHARYVLTQRKLSSVWIREGRSLSPDHRARLRRRERYYIGQWTEAIKRCYPNLTAAQAEVAALTALGTLNTLPAWPRGMTPEELEHAVSAYVIGGLDRLGKSGWDASEIAV